MDPSEITAGTVSWTMVTGTADDELPPPRGVRWELSEKQFSCL